MASIEQSPAPGACLVRHRGDVLTFRLSAPGRDEAEAFLRTNAGGAAIRRREIVRHVEADEPILAHDWQDLPMRRAEAGTFTLDLPLLEVGRMEAKAYLIHKDRPEPEWPGGGNVTIKVEPSDTVAANTLYSAFVRQFGPFRSQGDRAIEGTPEMTALDENGYSVIPPSGTFRALTGELGHIMNTLGFRVLQLLPIHPVPTTYARMGRFGSPFAVLDFEEIEPALAEFDRRTTPLDQFQELVDGVHARSGKVFLDIPLNHTGWASRLQIHRPEWFARGADRTFESPGAWGVTWKDLSKLDYRHRDLWTYMAGVLLYWCRQGVDGFRCDAGYMIPIPVWTYIVAKVRDAYPDTVFLLEGLGGSPETVEQLLDESNLDWAYSELFQNLDRRQIESYLPGCLQVSNRKGLLVHFAETHDNDRLAARSPAHARLRTAFAALFSQDGGFGITNGVEWFAKEKMQVHGAPSLNWGAAENQVEAIRRLNAILSVHPCFHAGARMRMVDLGPGPVVGLVREATSGERLLVAANLDEHQAARASWAEAEFSPREDRAVDLITGRAVDVTGTADRRSCELAAADMVCLSADVEDLKRIEAREADTVTEPAICRRQRLRAKALDVWTRFRGLSDVSELDVDVLTEHLERDPEGYVEWAAGNGVPSVIPWQWPGDVRRRVMIPPGWALCLHAPHRFTVDVRQGETVLARETSLPTQAGDHVVLLLLPADVGDVTVCTLDVTLLEEGNVKRERAEILRLPREDRAMVRRRWPAAEIRRRGTAALCTNRHGAMSLVRGAWGQLWSRYDAWLAANMDPDVPVDRQVLLTRCRGWVVYRGYSQPLNDDCLCDFGRTSDGDAAWRFEAPCGMGRKVALTVRLHLDSDANAVTAWFERSGRIDDDWLDDAEAISLVIRPDVEDRSFHAVTRAHRGPEHDWPKAVTAFADGFRFGPGHNHALTVRAMPGSFTPEQEWHYMESLPAERQRGLEDATDLFSPGYFTLTLKGGESAALRASDGAGAAEKAAGGAGLRSVGEEPETVSLPAALREALRAFVVKRNDSLTVIAGYPWFLDWGRDTMICLRGMLAAGMHEEAEAILRGFARFEENGTLPNMIRGDDASNRDTSDAPLWFFVACGDALAVGPESDLLDCDVGGRTVRDVLFSIAKGYRRGTPNGIQMDPDSGLIFSPSHFTWMDTNHPAGTPREGYPIEIQALWHYALRLLAGLDPKGDWSDLADTVRASIHRLFVDTRSGADARQTIGLSDCLHTSGYRPAAEAEADDHLRPNQLLAVTLGVIEDETLCRRIVTATGELLVPGAIRSLADRPVTYALPVRREGTLLNDPLHPYWGTYVGDEDTSRKPAYHNGTAWTWIFPSYVEAQFMAYGEPAREAGLAVLQSSTELIQRGTIGQTPEIVDGNAPHAERGCGAQAWGVTELYRVLAFLGTTT